MNEKQWRQSKNPEAMLSAAIEQGVSDRKLRLFSVAFTRTCWDLLSDSARQTTLAAERYADDPVGYSAMIEAGAAVKNSFVVFTDEAPMSRWDVPPEENLGRNIGYADAKHAARNIVHLGTHTRKKEYTPLLVEFLHEVFGNPFSPPEVKPAWRAWNNGTIVQMARTIYRDRLFKDLPQLGDALEEGGCSDRAILDHCRDGNTRHVRGCWVLDLLLQEKPCAAITDEDEEQKLILPHPGWLITLKPGSTPEHKSLVELLPQAKYRDFTKRQPEVLFPGKCDVSAVKEADQVKSVEQVWYFAPGEGYVLPVKPAGRLVKAEKESIALYTNRDKAFKDLAGVYSPLETVMQLRRKGPMEGRRLVNKILEGDQSLLDALAGLLEECGHDLAKKVRAIAGGESRAQRVFDPRDDQQCQRLNTQYRRRACPGCKKATLVVSRVRKGGANQGRLFAKCYECDHFEWVSDAPPAPAADPARTEQDSELIESQNKSMLCPKCGKPRQSKRVQKEGANHGRLFLTCTDSKCGSFEWVSPAPKSATTTAPATNDEELNRARAQVTTCPDCNEPITVQRVRKSGANQGKLFRKCDGCGAFGWVVLQ